jgi:hypothetical protein
VVNVETGRVSPQKNSQVMSGMPREPQFTKQVPKSPKMFYNLLNAQKLPRLIIFSLS